jgi:acetate kinase
MDWAGIALDESLNEKAHGEAMISGAHSKVQVWVVPTNEEIVVARQAAEAISGKA